MLVKKTGENFYQVTLTLFSFYFYIICITTYLTISTWHIKCQSKYRLEYHVKSILREVVYLEKKYVPYMTILCCYNDNVD